MDEQLRQHCLDHDDDGRLLLWVVHEVVVEDHGWGKKGSMDVDDMVDKQRLDMDEENTLQWLVLSLVDIQDDCVDILDDTTMPNLAEVAVDAQEKTRPFDNNPHEHSQCYVTRMNAGWVVVVEDLPFCNTSPI